ncbi:MAG: MutS family DNA mismatch repair protein [Planctomycetota bacterium]
MTDSVSESPAGDAAVGADYELALRDLNAATARDRQTDRRFGMARLLAFFAAAGLLLVGYGTEGLALAGHCGWLFVIAFLALVVANEPTKIRLAGDRLRREVLQRLLRRVRRDWDGLEKIGDVGDPWQSLAPETVSVAGDLDLLGKTSLLRLVSVAGTAQGLSALAHWITGPADRQVATARAKWSQSLVSRRNERILFYEAARVSQDGESSPDKLARWAASDRWLETRGGWFLKWSVVSIVLAVIFILLVAAGAVSGASISPESAGEEAAGFAWSDPLSIGAIGLLGLAGVNLLISMFGLGRMHEAFAVAIGHRQTLHEYQELFALAKSFAPDAKLCQFDPSLAQVAQILHEGPQSAAVGIADLAKVSRFGAPRQSAALFPIYIPLQLLGLYDLWVLRRLEVWQREYGGHVAAWFEALGQTEAAASVAAFRDENPSWTEPQWVDLDDRPAVLESKSLGHPLLPDGVRVTNDVTIGPPQHFLLVTGSNMSGKSTMLRSVGLNVALAAAGGPVCARQFRLPPLEMATSIRVRDDLADGVSFYMAELKRLREVVDQSQRLSQRLSEHPQRVCLYLLDEILQGTNSRERQIAVAQVLQRLMGHGSIGAITTHDLELADDESVSETAVTVHFRETITTDSRGEETMQFDYRMRQGVCPTTNALKLMELIGL